MKLFKDKLQKKYESYIGRTFNNLTVIDVVDKFWQGECYQPIILCKCSCGNKCHVKLSGLKSNHIKSCGCLRKEIGKRRTHGMSQSKVTRHLILQKIDVVILNINITKITEVEELSFYSILLKNFIKK